MKKAISILLTVFMLAAMSTFSLVSAEGVSVRVFGQSIEFNDDMGYPFIEPETARTLIPMRIIFEKIGADVQWLPETRTVKAVCGDKTVSLTIDSTVAMVNDREFTLDQAPIIKNDRTMVPIRFISESLDLNVDFDGATTTVIIEKAPAFEKTVYENKTYRVNRAIEKGEFYVVKSADNAAVKLYSTEPSADDETAGLIQNIPVNASLFIDNSGAEYIKFENCKAYYIAYAPDSSSYKNNTYKEGVNITAGKYTALKNESQATSSYSIYAKPYGTYGKPAAIKTAEITENIQISIEKGQYIELNNAKLTAVTSGSSTGTSGSSDTPTATPAPDIFDTDGGSISADTFEYYAEEASVPDFGESFGIALTDSDTENLDALIYSYPSSAASGFVTKYYVMLVLNGFEKLIDISTDSSIAFNNIDSGRSVIIEVNTTSVNIKIQSLLDSATEDYIETEAGEIPEGTKYYIDNQTVPSFGANFNSNLISKYPLKSATIYKYGCSATDRRNLSSYFALLQRAGFGETQVDANVYEKFTSGNFVVDVLNDNVNIYIKISTR